MPTSMFQCFTVVFNYIRNNDHSTLRYTYFLIYGANISHMIHDLSMQSNSGIRHDL